MFRCIFKRLKEHSTRLGLIAFATYCGAAIATERSVPVLQSAFARPEKGLYINFYEVWDDTVCIAGKDVTAIVQALLQ